MRPAGSAADCGFEQREHLAGVQQPVRVEGGLEPALLLQFMGVELHRHQVALFHADAMLAGQAAADLDAQLQDVGAEFLGGMEAGGIVGIEHDQRMQIAVAGVEDVGDLQAVAVRHLLDAAQHQRQLAGRDGAVHAQVVGADPADRAERALAAFPDRQRFLRPTGIPSG